jgi:general secretion pathway protein G
MCIHTGYSKSGFSLLEIIIAIAIIALFTILPILAYTSYQKKSRDEKRISDISRVAQALESYKAEKGTYPMNLEDLVKDGYLPDDRNYFLPQGGL